MNAFIVAFKPESKKADAALETALKGLPNSRQLFLGVWIVVTKKRAAELHSTLLGYRFGHSRPPFTVFRVDGTGLDWDASSGVDQDARDWLLVVRESQSGIPREAEFSISYRKDSHRPGRVSMKQPNQSPEPTRGSGCDFA